MPESHNPCTPRQAYDRGLTPNHWFLPSVSHPTNAEPIARQSAGMPIIHRLTQCKLAPDSFYNQKENQPPWMVEEVILLKQQMHAESKIVDPFACLQVFPPL